MSILTSTAFMMIIKGVAVTPQDSRSAEVGLSSIDLLDPQGFCCDDYAMQIPNLKNSAVWADSPTTDGRKLISGVLGNVTETIRLQLTASTIVQMAAMLSKLSQFKRDCKAYWDTLIQNDPVYLKHQIIGEPGPRFALLYDIDVNIETPIEPSDPNRTVTLSIEREPYWRGLAPGDNPKKWNCFVEGVNFDTSNSNLRGGVRHTATKTVLNRQEFASLNTLQAQNYIDIPAAKVVGDAPPLVCMAIQPTQGGSGLLENIFLARSTKRTSIVDKDGNTEILYNSFPAAGGSLGVDATFVTDATLGIKHIPVSPLARYASISFATATDQVRMTWQALSTFPHVNPNVLRGRYQIFLRGEQNAGALGNTSVYVRFRTASGYFYTSPAISPKITVANTVQLNDLGIVTIPSVSGGYSGIDGKGLSVNNYYAAAGEFDGNIIIELNALRSTGAATLRIYDLILMPIDEGAVYIVPIVGASGGPESVIYDNTGYFMHGKPDSYGAGRLDDGSGGLDNEVVAEVRGEMTLEPKVNNRIYLLADSPTIVGSNPADTLSVFVNIVPRWIGLRDA